MEIAIKILTVMAPIIAAFITGWFVHNAKGKKEVNQKLLRAYQDIRFFQQLEKVHNELNIGRGESDKKVLARNIVRNEFGYTHSGDTPSMVEKRIARLSDKIK